MKVIVGNGNFGTEEIKNLLQDLFQSMRLDRNNDGKISKGEWFGAISGLVPSLFNIGDVTEEVKDLTQAEFDEIIRWVGKNFPDYTGVGNDVEDLVRQTLLVIAEMIKWVQLLATVRRNRNELPAGEVVVAIEAPAAPVAPVDSVKVIDAAAQKVRAGAVKLDPKLDQDTANPDDTPKENA